MVKVLFLHTTGDWWESRYQFKQIPALRANGFEVYHVIRAQNTDELADDNIIQIPNNEVKWIRSSGGINLFFRILRLKHSVIQICNLELLPLGILLSIITKKKVFYDCIEDHYNAMLQSKTWLPKWSCKILALGVKLTEGIASLTFKGFIVSDPSIYKTHKLLPNYKKVLFYNMPPKKIFEIINSDSKVKKYDLVVLGSMSVRTGVLDVLEAISMLKIDGIYVNVKLIGDPFKDKQLKARILDIIKVNNIEEQITITGKIPFEQVPQQLSVCKIGVIPLLNLPKFQNNIAMKQWEYMALGMPVITSNLIPQNLFIKENFNGLFYSKIHFLPKSQSG